MGWFRFSISIKGVFRQTPLLQTNEFVNLHLIFNSEPFGVLSFSFVFSKNFVGINPSWIQFESTPESTKATVTRLKSSIIIKILTFHF